MLGAFSHPESITSARDGTLFIGRLGDGRIIRANPRSGKASLFVAPGVCRRGLQDPVGLLERLECFRRPLRRPRSRRRSKRVQSSDGRPKLSVPLPGPNAFCNDITVDARGAVYVTDSAAPNVLRLPCVNRDWPGLAAGPAFSAMPRYRRSARKRRPVGMGQLRESGFARVRPTCQWARMSARAPTCRAQTSRT
jgi:sugar lactone lactonase YvrE